MRINKAIASWAIYDWANSTFSTTVLAGFFPLFFKKYWSAGVDSSVTTQRLGYAIALSSLVIALLSPILGAISDSRSLKKRFCLLFMILGSLCCVSLYSVPEGSWEWAIGIYSLALVGFTGSCNFYDSLINSVADDDQADQVSALGYSLGYLGGGVLFAINVLMFLKPDLFGIPDPATAVKVSFVTVAVWWFVFSIPMMLFVHERSARDDSQGSVGAIVKQAVIELVGTARKLRGQKNLMLFMLAFWLYIDGVYTVMTMAVDLGSSLGLESKDLISALLLTQFIGFPAAFIYGIVAKKVGARGPLIFGISIYAVTCILATQISQGWHFYVLAGTIGLVQGGVQALSRSIFARMIPAENSGEYFGFFNVIGKFASVVGPLIVAVTTQVTGHTRYGMLGLIVLFVAGVLILRLVKMPEETAG